MKFKLIFSNFTLDSSNITGGVTYNQIINSEKDLIYGCASMARVEFSIFENTMSEVKLFEGQEFSLNISQTEDGTDNYSVYGIFKVESVNKEHSKAKIIAYDMMCKFEMYSDDFLETISYPTTVRDVLESACDYCDVEIDESVWDTLVNLNMPVNTNISAENDTVRSIIGYIAEMCVCNLYMDSSGKLNAIRYDNACSDTSKTLDNSQYVSLKSAEYFTDSIDSIICNTAYGMVMHPTSGENSYYMSSNPVLNTLTYQQVQDAVGVIFDNIKYISYTPCEIKLFQDFGVKIGERIKVNGIETVVMEKTMRADGVTLKSTGGRKREVQVDDVVHKNDLSPYVTTDKLSAQIGAFLNSEEGTATIISATEGEFVTQDEFLTAKTSINQSITSLESEISLEAAYGSNTIGSNVRAMLQLFANKDSSNIRLSANALSLTATPMPPSTDETEVGDYIGVANTYSFTKEADGYYTSTNAGVPNSCSYVYVGFNFTETTEITIRCCSYGENHFDYGIISNVDTWLSESATADETGVYHSFKGEANPEFIDIKMSIPAGNHYITVKYIKDSSNDMAGDYFKFICLKVTKSDSMDTVLSLSSGGTVLTSAKITIKGQVTFESLETAGATTINGANIMTGTITADKIVADGLKVNKVYFNDPDRDIPVMSSQLSGVNGRVKIGVHDYTADWAQYLELYGTQIFLTRTGYEPSSDAQGVKINLYEYGGTISIKPNSSGIMDLGGLNNYLRGVYSEYYYFDSGDRLYAYNGRLYFNGAIIY